MKLIQERYSGDPWKILATCILLNRVRGSFADPIIEQFFKRFPNPTTILHAMENEIMKIIRPLGLYRRRIDNLWAMSRDYRRKRPFDQIRGIGKYGRDSWMIFVEGNLNVKPTDKKLRLYLREKT